MSIFVLSSFSKAVGRADDTLLESVIKYAHLALNQAVMVRVDTNRFDSRTQVEELCQFAQIMDSNTRIQAQREAKSWTRDRVGSVRESKHAKPQRTAKYDNCVKIGHFKRDCGKTDAKNTIDIVLGTENRK
uniref:AlNc14C56G4244 protein n=1 Tax=Albugo laibachii Nc14 TaxID=890382 RepID=F0WC61_9STRA|nr:AlNc14C56G4244 [Albugo laibachii Nc14]|eukprot:CCA18774.1 AlNc14C56G4244 [Albugo laibachii Nc14]